MLPIKVGDFVMTNYAPGEGYDHKRIKDQLVRVMKITNSEYRINYVCQQSDLASFFDIYAKWSKEGTWMNRLDDLREATVHDMVKFLFKYTPRKECVHEFRAALLSKLKDAYGEPPQIDQETENREAVPNGLSEQLLKTSNMTPTPTLDGKPGVAFVDVLDSNENSSWVRVVSL